MIFAFLRLALVAFVLLTIAYGIVSLWSRQMRRRKLRKEWEAEGRPGDRRDYVEKGLDEYDDSFRRKLILLIYIVPVLVVAFIVYAVNFM
ncbi:hypothetical protein SAMN06297129_0759 [Pseudooceanicola antarcticus]|uniref:Cation/multidrug efflux pump n=1 Tax=Pseudooceanicola antarcticus TaxID=1247613 RepID=A0A285I153_9RHOB|nr:hypothetical protein [Pseudooceanicola antarcticus]SNY40671.1 hypothetical protein SAMN06297129_0759 [Pseudooceanicola antarcticus]